jgi:hypothetical protein
MATQGQSVTRSGSCEIWALTFQPIGGLPSWCIYWLVKGEKVTRPSRANAEDLIGIPETETSKCLEEPGWRNEFVGARQGSHSAKAVVPVGLLDTRVQPQATDQDCSVNCVAVAVKSSETIVCSAPVRLLDTRVQPQATDQDCAVNSVAVAVNSVAIAVPLQPDLYEKIRAQGPLISLWIVQRILNNHKGAPCRLQTIGRKKDWFHWFGLQNDAIFCVKLTAGHCVAWDARRQVLMETDPKFPYALQCPDLKSGLSYIDDDKQNPLGSIDRVYQIHFSGRKNNKRNRK